MNFPSTNAMQKFNSCLLALLPVTLHAMCRSTPRLCHQRMTDRAIEGRHSLVGRLSIRQIKSQSSSIGKTGPLLTQTIALSYLPATAGFQPRLCPPRPVEKVEAVQYPASSSVHVTPNATGNRLQSWFGNSQICIVGISLNAYQMGYKRV